MRWRDTTFVSERQDVAFSHGIALAVVLAAALICGRIALHLENGGGAPLGDTAAIIGSVAVLADLARVWRDGSDPLRRFSVTLTHALALAAVAGVAMLIARYEQRRRS
ncbi:MAG: hypothetical protein QOJ13_3626 [Gaiellales bacterium]|nr:hypothetical protein [Gaiellales bacterium]